MIEDFLILITKMRENKTQTQHPTLNIQMMRSKPCEEDHNVNIVMRSGVATGKDKGKQPETEGWVCKAVEKEVWFDLNWAKETFMEAKKNFAEASTSGSQEKSARNSEVKDVDPSLLVTFIKTCMKPLRD